MPDSTPRCGLLDTSVLLGLYSDGPRRISGPLPDLATISAITLAELACGPIAASTPSEHALRLDVLLRARLGFDAVPFDEDAARAYARIHAATLEAGPALGAARTTAMMIAAVALANDLALYTRSETDYAHLTDLIQIVVIN